MHCDLRAGNCRFRYLDAQVHGACPCGSLSWNNALGGSAATASNWNPVQIPTTVDDLTFNLGGSYSVTWNAAVANSRTHTYRQGTVTHTISSPHTVSSGITVGNLAGDTILGDPDGGSGTIFLNGGSFIGGQPVQMLSGSALTGMVTVDADITVGSGRIVPTGASGLTFNGVISNADAGVFGTKIHFGAGGGYAGSGVCDTEITGDSAAAITATGNLSIGKNSAAGFSYYGALAVGSQDVTLVDSNGTVLGGLMTVDTGGSLSCSTGIGL